MFSNVLWIYKSGFSIDSNLNISFIFLRFILFLGILFICMYITFLPGAHGGQEKVLELLGLDIRCCELPCGLWEPIPGPLQEKLVLLTMEASLQPMKIYLLYTSQNISVNCPIKLFYFWSLCGTTQSYFQKKKKYFMYLKKLLMNPKLSSIQANAPSSPTSNVLTDLPVTTILICLSSEIRTSHIFS